MIVSTAGHKEKKLSFIKRDLVRNKGIYIMFIPVLAYFVLFHYIPMYYFHYINVFVLLLMYLLLLSNIF